jgi:hypothetical protein
LLNKIKGKKKKYTNLKFIFAFKNGNKEEKKVREKFRKLMIQQK